MCWWRFRRKEQEPVQPAPSLEDFWNSKYPKATVVYQGRELPNTGMIDVDVRDFFVNVNDYQLQQIVAAFSGLSDDEKALECLRWVIQHVSYVSDKAEFGLDEFWCYPNELLKVLKGDCDDGAILLANLMLAAGVPYWKIRLTAGLVPEGGHAYVTYFCEKGGCWVALDWCYYPSLDPVDGRPDYKLSPIYREVWFSWNVKYAFCAGVKGEITLKKVRFL